MNYLLSIKDLSSLAGKILVVGDLHGVYDEFITLCQKENPEHIVLTGDFSNRGPDFIKLFSLLKTQKNIYSVKGNHEVALVRWLSGFPLPSSDYESTKEFISSLSREEKEEMILWLSSLPDVIMLPHGGIVVHAGFHLHYPLVEQNPYALQYMRSRGSPFDSHEEIKNSKNPKKWYEETQLSEWQKRTIFFGHTVIYETLVKENIISLDQGAVFGMGLRGAVWENGKAKIVMTPTKAYLKSVYSW